MAEETAALARVVSEEESGGDNVEKLRLLMASLHLKWEDERKERDRWTREDRRENYRLRLIAMFGSALIGEGASGARPSARQVVDMAFEYADAVMVRLDAEARAATPPST